MYFIDPPLMLDKDKVLCRNLVCKLDLEGKCFDLPEKIQNIDGNRFAIV